LPQNSQAWLSAVVMGFESVNGSTTSSITKEVKTKLENRMMLLAFRMSRVKNVMLARRW
jgi:hypothetical protein